MTVAEGVVGNGFLFFSIATTTQEAIGSAIS
jgi:hypothetical protein